MDSYELGKVGITLLAINALLIAALAGIEVLNTAVAMEGVGKADLSDFMVAVAGALGVALVFGVLPASLLLWRRHALAERWCANSEGTTESNISVGALLRVGLILFGVYNVLEGALGAVGWAVSAGSSLAIGSSEAREHVLPNAVGQFVRAALQLGLGAFLIIRSSKLAEKWS